VKVAVAGTVTVLPAGWVVTTGTVLTVRVAARLVSLPALLVAMQRY